METSRPIRIVVAVALVVLASVGCGLGARAQAPAPSAAFPARDVGFDPEFDHWVHVLVRQSESPNAEVARSAQVALDGLGARGRERADALRAEGRRGPVDRPAARLGPHGTLQGGVPNEGRAPRGAPRHDDEFGPHEFLPRDGGPRGFGPPDGGPRTGPRPDGPPPRCGPGCCLHGRGPGPGGDRAPLERDPRGPPPRRPDFDPDPRSGPPSGRGPRPPLPLRDEPSRTPRSVPKET